MLLRLSFQIHPLKIKLCGFCTFLFLPYPFLLSIRVLHSFCAFGLPISSLLTLLCTCPMTRRVCSLASAHPWSTLSTLCPLVCAVSALRPLPLCSFLFSQLASVSSTLPYDSDRLPVALIPATTECHRPAKLLWKRS